MNNDKIELVDRLLQLEVVINFKFLLATSSRVRNVKLNKKEE